MQENLSSAGILRWLREDDPARLEELWRAADEARRAHVGDAVHLRGLVEISNHCVRRCGYCGLRAGGAPIERYRMNEDEILACARQARDLGYGTLVMQAGEDYGITKDWMAGVIRRIKDETALAVTLSLGERPGADLAAWREAGADRYLLRFETSDPELYTRIHPAREKGKGQRTKDKGQRTNVECGMRNAEYCSVGETPASSDCGLRIADCGMGNDINYSAFRIPHSALEDSAIVPRIAILLQLRALGYEIGSGVMIGIPGQSSEALARDIELFRELDLDMIGVGPFIPHPGTPLGAPGPAPASPAADQVPATELMTYKVVALTRLACPQANIPSTTALATINTAQGRELGLARGANVVMPNLTPPRYRQLYTIYPGKACLNETAEACAGCLAGRIMALGRTVGRGPGGRRR